MATAAGVLLAVAVPAIPASAATHTVSSVAPVTIPHYGQGIPYPSVLDVDAPGEQVESVEVSLTIAHTILSAVQLLLEAPDGTAVKFMSRVGCSFGPNTFQFTFSQDAAAPIPELGTPVSGTYLPSTWDGTVCGYALPPEAMPAPAPSTFGTSLDDFAGSPADGEWRLYAYDDIGGDSGTISQWTLEIETSPAPVAPQVTSAASITGAVGTPLTHEVTATGTPEPTLTIDPADLPEGLAFDGAEITGTPTEDGTFTVPVTASNGTTPDATQDLEIEILEAPAGPVIARAPGQAALTNSQPVTFTLTFDEAASGLAASDLSVLGTAGGGSVSLAGAGTTYTATVDGLSSDGTVSLSLAEGSWQNGQGHLGGGASGPEVELDTTAPELNGPAEGVFRTTTEPGEPGATVTYDFFTPSAAGNATPALAPEDTLECSPASGSFFAIGSTDVDCTATDPAGNSTAASFEVIVVDDEAPVIDSLEDVSLELADGETRAPVEFDVPSASDNSGEVDVTCDLEPGTSLPEGERTVTCTAVDPSGNTSTSAFTVSISAADDGEDGTEEEDGTDEDGTDEDGTEDEDDDLAETGTELAGLGLLTLVLLTAGGARVLAAQRRLTDS